MQEYSKEYIEDLYIKQDISRTELITLLDSNLNSVKKLLKNYNISKSNYKQRGKKSSKTQKENYNKKSKADKNKISKKRKKQSSSKRHKQLLSQINKDYQEHLEPATKIQRNKARSNAVKTA